MAFISTEGARWILLQQESVKDRPSHDTKQWSDDGIFMVDKPRSYLHSCSLIFIVYGKVLWINDENISLFIRKCMILSEITFSNHCSF